MDGTIRIVGLALFTLVLSACGQGAVNATSTSLPVSEFPGGPTPDDPADDMVDKSQAVGFYSSGSLIGASNLPLESFAHLKIFRPRNRGWGTQTLVNTIVNAATAFRKQFPVGDRVQIGDMAAHEGGQLASHASHQNGLDADVAYLKANFKERNPNLIGDHGFEEVFVSGGKVTTNFDTTRNWFLLKEVVLRKNIGRIFVDPKIKQLFCDRNLAVDSKATLAVRTEVLRRLRPYPNHDDHFHMRIACPSRSGRCVGQEEPPAGSGCTSIEMVSFDEHEL